MSKFKLIFLRNYSLHFFDKNLNRNFPTRWSLSDSLPVDLLHWIGFWKGREWESVLMFLTNTRYYTFCFHKNSLDFSHHGRNWKLSIFIVSRNTKKHVLLTICWCPNSQKRLEQKSFQRNCFLLEICFWPQVGAIFFSSGSHSMVFSLQKILGSYAHDVRLTLVYW